MIVGATFSRLLLIRHPERTTVAWKLVQGYFNRSQKTFEPGLRALFESLAEGKIDVLVKKVWGLVTWWRESESSD